mmetsp:Transcript_44163/g.127512  ORF Transcript_44163/g.127512 Transcript_44163/m.127512 type:complete len:246 (+) Transcript_44163:652-1389(+)
MGSSGRRGGAERQGAFCGRVLRRLGGGLSLRGRPRLCRRGAGCGLRALLPGSAASRGPLRTIVARRRGPLTRLGGGLDLPSRMLRRAGLPLQRTSSGAAAPIGRRRRSQAGSRRRSGLEEGRWPRGSTHEGRRGTSAVGRRRGAGAPGGAARRAQPWAALRGLRGRWLRNRCLRGRRLRRRHLRWRGRHVLLCRDNPGLLLSDLQLGLLHGLDDDAPGELLRLHGYRRRVRNHCCHPPRREITGR